MFRFLNKPISRRTVLRGSAGVGISLPFLEIMRAPVAQAQASQPTRYVFLMTSNGVIPENWFPENTGALGALPESLAPLSPLKDQALVLSGVNAEPAKAIDGNPHHVGFATLLACSGTSGLRGDAGGGLSPTSATLDQYLADKIGGETKLRSIEAVVNDRGEDPLRRMSWKGEKLWVHPEGRPQQVFERVFSGTETGTQQTALAAQRKSILDFALSDYQRFANEVGSADRQRVDLHLTSLRELELELTRGADVAGCGKPALEGDPTDTQVATKQHLDVLAAAISCDATRVASLYWEGAQSDLSHPWVDAGSHHTMSHQESDSNVRAALTRVRGWYMDQITQFAQKLAASPDVGGSVLDNTIIVWTSEVAIGGHNFDNIPLLLLGGKNLGLSLGRHLDVGGRSTNDVYTAVLNAGGLPDATWGSEQFNSGPLTEIMG